MKTVFFNKNKRLILGFMCAILFLFGGCTGNPGSAVSDTEADLSSKPVRMMCPVYLNITFSDMVHKAKTIVYGEIREVLPAEQKGDDDFKTVFTPYLISPIEVLKGENTGNPIRYDRMGGEYDGIVYKIEGDDLELKAGTRLFLFLGKYDSDLGPASVAVEQDGKLMAFDDKGMTPTETTTQAYLEKIKAELQSQS